MTRSVWLDDDWVTGARSVWIDDDWLALGVTGYVGAVLADSPAAFWGCQDASGGLVDTVAGRNASEYGTGTVVYQADGPGDLYAVELPGTGNKAFSIPDNDLWSSASFTAEALVWLDPSFGTGQRFLMTKHAGSGSLHELALIVYSGTYKVYNMVTNTGNTGFRLNDAASGLTAGAWHHMAITYDNATTTLTTYVDGIQKASTSSGSGTRRANSGGDLYIGTLPASTATEAWKGRLSCVAFYDRALSGAEVLAHAEAVPA